METLTLGELRGLARLHRAGVDGATERLQSIVREERDVLPALLGFPAKNLERLLGEADPVALLVATIEGAPRVARAARAREENERAQRLANELADRLTLDEHGDCELPVGELVLITRLGDHRHLAFGERGGVPTRRLRELFHACRRVTACSVFVRATTLDVIYETPSSRGIVRLHLSLAAACESVITIPVPEPVKLVAPSVVATPAPVSMTPRVTPATPTDRPRPGPHPPRSFGQHFFEALLVAALGGAP